MKLAGTFVIVAALAYAKAPPPLVRKAQEAGEGVGLTRAMTTANSVTLQKTHLKSSKTARKRVEPAAKPVVHTKVKSTGASTGTTSKPSNIRGSTTSTIRRALAEKALPNLFDRFFS